MRDGKLAYRETIVDGFENLPTAFAGLFRGDNVGKMLVRVGPTTSNERLELDHGRAEQVLPGDREHALARACRRRHGDRPVARTAGPAIDFSQDELSVRA